MRHFPAHVQGDMVISEKSVYPVFIRLESLILGGKNKEKSISLVIWKNVTHSFVFLLSIDRKISVLHAPKHLAVIQCKNSTPSVLFLFESKKRNARKNNY